MFCAFVRRKLGRFAKLNYGQTCLSVKPAVILGGFGGPSGLFIGAAAGMVVWVRQIGLVGGVSFGFCVAASVVSHFGY